MLCPVVVVIHHVDHQWDNPEYHIDARVDEKKAQLALDGSTAELHRRIGSGAL